MKITDILRERMDKKNRILETYESTGGNGRETARILGINESSVRRHVKKRVAEEKPFEAPDLPDEELTVEEIIAHRKREFSRRKIARDARKLIPVKVNIDGPIGILHMGDPHVDDAGTDISQIEADMKTVNDTEGLFAGTVGDLQNLWVGRLSALYANQSTTARQAWRLVEWLIGGTDWLFIVRGNHDLFCGNGDPLDFMRRGFKAGPMESHGVRLSLNLPSGRHCVINARHDFRGNSQWNTAHGPSKAAQMGWRDHILTCGHTHTSGYQVVKDPATGLISHALRVASYKKYDDYAEELGCMDSNIFCAPVTIIDPRFADDDARFITTIFNPQEGAEFLTYKRKKWNKGSCM